MTGTPIVTSMTGFDGAAAFSFHTAHVYSEHRATPRATLTECEPSHMSKKKNKNRKATKSATTRPHSTQANKRAKLKLRSPPPIRLPSTASSDKEEHVLADWLLTQQLFNEAGVLPADKVAQLDEALPGWMDDYTDGSGAHALCCDNEELQFAFEIWWNLLGLSETNLTFTEIRLMAALEA